MIVVERAGPLTTVQDLGRPGWAHLGVPRSGALDVPALRRANRLVGNPDGAAALEITLGGFTARLAGAGTVALTGADAELRIDGTTAAGGVAVPVPAGGRIEVRRARRGLRCYLAVRGGIAVPRVLGSRSTDTLSGLGPAVVRDSDELPVDDTPPRSCSCARGKSCRSRTEDEARLQDRGEAGDGEVSLRVRVGPRDDWFTPGAVETLLFTPYTISPQSNRVGTRLAGPSLVRAVAGELPSEGLVLGAVQVPADGQPLVFLADHPTTGGYPVIAVVVAADLPLLAQARPGTTVRFRGPQQ